MNINADPDDLQKRIDGALKRLPTWQPREDFSRRLAAAAHRQHLALEETRPALRQGVKFARFTDLCLVMLGCGALASVLAQLPWTSLAQRPLQVTALCLGAALLAGATAVWPLLRQRSRI